MGDYEKDFELQLEVLAQIDSLRKERSDLLNTRQANLPGSPALKAARLEHENSKKQALKSDLKKSNAFVKRLKAITTEGIQQCVRYICNTVIRIFIALYVKVVRYSLKLPILLMKIFSQGNGKSEFVAFYIRDSCCNSLYSFQSH